MTKNPSGARESDKNAFLRHLRLIRAQNIAVAALSVVAAGVIVALTSTTEIGSFAFHALVFLLLINALLALLQFQRVLRPVTRILDRLDAVSKNIAGGEVPSLESCRLPPDPVFANLEASILDVIDRLSIRVRSAESERDDLKATLLKAVPLTMFRIGRSGRVNAIVKDPYELAACLGLEIGREPPAATWGAKNEKVYRERVAEAFADSAQHWFDLILCAECGNAPRHLRGLAASVNPREVMVVISDLTSIDQKVARENEQIVATESVRRHAALRKFAAFVHRNLGEALAARDEALAAELAALAGETRYSFACATPAVLKTLVESPSLKALLPESVRLVATVSSEAMPAVDLDLRQMTLALEQLVRNAVEAIGPRSGRIWLSLEPSVLSEDAAKGFRHGAAFRPGRGVLLTVVDDGAGMSQTMLDCAFDPLFSTKGEQRGLGLTAALEIVNAHGGAISVKSSPGYGTTLYVFLPVSRITEDEIRLARQIAPNGEILLVDDDPTILHTTRLVLKALKVAAHPASNEPDALAKIRALRTRLRAAFIDANVNCASSAPLVRKIRDEFPGLKIVVVSGAPEESVAKEFGAVAYDAFLSKPYTAKDIAAVLENCPPPAAP